MRFTWQRQPLFILQACKGIRFKFQGKPGPSFKRVVLFPLSYSGVQRPGWSSIGLYLHNVYLQLARIDCKLYQIAILKYDSIQLWYNYHFTPHYSPMPLPWRKLPFLNHSWISNINKFFDFLNQILSREILSCIRIKT